MTSIGGFFGLHLPDAGKELSVWHDWTRNAKTILTFRNARSALRHLLRIRRPRQLWLPAYSCTALGEAANGVTAALYPLTDTLDPDLVFLGENLRPTDAVLVINYFGRPPNRQFRAWARAMDDIDWIEDCAHATTPSSGDEWAAHRLFSPRKLLGVIDGGLLTTNHDIPQPNYVHLLQEDLIGPAFLRFEDQHDLHAELIYSRYTAQEEAMTAADNPMTRLTLSILQRTPLEPLIEARQRNFSILSAHFHGISLLPDRNPVYAPFGFPVRLRQRDNIARVLRERHVFAAVHWRNILGQAQHFPFENALSQEQLTIPCDHRYTADDICRVAATLSDLIN